MGQQIIDLKEEIWGNKKVILHSSDIRRCEKEFSLLFDPEKKQKFYTCLNAIMRDGDYTIITAGVNKSEYLMKYGKIGEDVYQVSLSYIIERLVFKMDDIPGEKGVFIYIEKRGEKEDRILSEHLQRVLSRGTYYVKPERLRALIKGFKFYDKKEDIIGLQIADLVAYPTARHIIDPERANPAFDVFCDKFYNKNGCRYGLKIFP
jgi:hypothetical protein